jgi:hypothetical protein
MGGGTGLACRLRIPPEFFTGDGATARAAAAIKAVGGVESVEVIPTTASLLIYHDPAAVNRDTLLNLLSTEGYTNAPVTRRRDWRSALGAVGFWVVRAVCRGAARS